MICWQLCSQNWTALRPSLDVTDEGKALRTPAELPVLSDEDIELSVDEGTLTIKGEKRHVGVFHLAGSRSALPRTSAARPRGLPAKTLVPHLRNTDIHLATTPDGLFPGIA